MIGPAVAGVIYGLAGSSVIFAVDATSFLVSAAFLSFAHPRASERAASEGLRRELSTGLRYVLKVPWLWITIGTFSIVLMVGYAAFQVLLPKLVEQAWHGGVGSYGLLFTLQGVGMLIGSVVVGQTAPTRKRGTTIYSLFTLNSAFTALIGLSPWYEAAAALQIGRGFCIGYAITLWETMLMQRVPQQMLSRVISMDWFGSIGLLAARARYLGGTLRSGLARNADRRQLGVLRGAVPARARRPADPRRRLEARFAEPGSR